MRWGRAPCTPTTACHASAMASAAARYRRAAQASSCDLPAVGALRRGPSNFERRVAPDAQHGGHRAVTARSSMFSTASSRAFSIHTMSSPLIFALSWLPPSSYCYCHTLPHRALPMIGALHSRFMPVPLPLNVPCRLLRDLSPPQRAITHPPSCRR